MLYWMTANRRVTWNFALDRALEWARETGRPLLVLEALRVGYRWASDRFHRFVVEGMRQHAAALAPTPVAYLHYLERRAGEGSGLLEALAQRAAVVVGDDYPAFFLPRMVAAAADRLTTRFEVVDSNGLLPIHSSPQAFGTAYAFRRHLQKALPDHLGALPQAKPDFSGLVALERNPPGIEPWQEGFGLPEGKAWSALPIDHAVAAPGKGMETTGGSEAARTLLATFLGRGLRGYAEDRRHPDRDGSSRLSAHLHWGHISAHEIVQAVLEHEGWTPLRLSGATSGKRHGWWGLSQPAEAFLDELVTWRELAFNTCVWEDRYARYESLPEWARATLEEHGDDPRPHLYTLEEFENAETHDELWNAAQRQLLEEGRIHNYLRMLWGKKILEWTPDAREALSVMIELNNKYALDGRDPNSYAGIFWVLGRYDRGWPERPIYGKIRSMTSDSTRRKVELKDYLKRYGNAE